MTPEQAQAIKNRRDRMAAKVALLRALPDAQKLGKRGSKRAWEGEVADLDKAIEMIDRTLRVIERPKTPPKPKRPSPPVELEPALVLARIRKTDSAELRVTAKIWQGKRFVDVRLWRRKGDGEFAPTLKGIAFEHDMIGDLVAGLRSAQQHV